MDENTSWQKQLTVGVVLLLVVGLLVGGVFGAIALKAADVAGVGNTPDPTTGPPPGLGPSTSSQAEPTSRPTTTSPQSTTDKPDPPKPPRTLIRLVALPQAATTFQRITLSGTYRRAAEGTILQVQRNEGSWVDFPVTATVSGGQFTTAIETGQVGANQFRMLDTATGKSSNVVIVQIS